MAGGVLALIVAISCIGKTLTGHIVTDILSKDNNSFAWVSGDLRRFHASVCLIRNHRSGGFRELGDAGLGGGGRFAGVDSPLASTTVQGNHLGRHAFSAASDAKTFASHSAGTTPAVGGESVDTSTFGLGTRAAVHVRIGFVLPDRRTEAPDYRGRYLDESRSPNRRTQSIRTGPRSCERSHFLKPTRRRVELSANGFDSANRVGAKTVVSKVASS